MSIAGTLTGRQAEMAAAAYLKGQGYSIIDQNWRNRWCEIDIIAQKARVLYLIEVKYRQSEQQGTGLDYITPRKLEQMYRAAIWYVTESGWSGDYSLAAIELTGHDFTVTAFIASVT